MNEQAMPDGQEQRRHKRRHRSKRPQTPAEVWSAVGGLLVGALVISLIFGTPVVGFVLLLAAASVAFAGATNLETRRRLTAFFGSEAVVASGGMAVGALVLSGIFGTPLLMIAVIVILTALVFLLGVFAPTLPGSPQVRAAEPPTPEQTPLPALPAQAQGEAALPIDLRALCRGLPPALAGDVFVTVEHLEQAAARAEAHGQTRAAFDARQSLHDYLPSTVEAWKAQDSADRRAEELAQALAEVRAIADSEDARAAQRLAWETQQRFLRSRSPDAALPEPDPERRG